MDKKVFIKIDDRPYLVKADQNIVDAAEEVGIFIPSLCYYENIQPPLGSCRVCIVMANGRPAAACSEKIREGMEIQVNSEELINMRKAIVEMMFAEGNHFCPACEKSGDCDLQGLSYRLGVKVSRFPHLFVDRLIDFKPQRIIIEQNRCIRCRRCVEEVITDDGHPVFSFSNRGDHTRVALDYEQEAKLSDEQAMRAMHICPTGSILVRGKSLARPRGERKYDRPDVKEISKIKSKIANKKTNGDKVIIATTSLAGCFGCHMSMLDIDEELIDMIELIEFNKSPLNDIKTFTKRCDVGIIEGGCCNEENVEVLRTFRENCDMLVAVGECAIWGGVPAMRNVVPLQECLEESFINNAVVENQPGIIPKHEDLPPLLEKVIACNEVVKIDGYIPGCPPDASHIWKVLKWAALGESYTLMHDEFKYD